MDVHEKVGAPPIEREPSRHEFRLPHNGCGKIPVNGSLISRTVSDDDAHCGDMMIARSALSPLSPRLRRAALCGFRLDRSARPSKSGDRAANALTAMLGNQGKRLSDNVREVECWFSHIILGHGVSLFGGEVEASNIPTIRRLIPSRGDHFRA